MVLIQRFLALKSFSPARTGEAKMSEYMLLTWAVPPVACKLLSQSQPGSYHWGRLKGRTGPSRCLPAHHDPDGTVGVLVLAVLGLPATQRFTWLIESASYQTVRGLLGFNHMILGRLQHFKSQETNLGEIWRRILASTQVGQTPDFISSHW